jgi:gluconate kinase
MRKILCALGIHRVDKWMWAMVDFGAYGFCTCCGERCYRDLTRKERDENQRDLLAWVVDYPKQMERMRQNHERIRKMIEDQINALAATSAPAPESVAAEPNELEDVETGEAKEE